LVVTHEARMCYERLPLATPSRFLCRPSVSGIYVHKKRIITHGEDELPSVLARLDWGAAVLGIVALIAVLLCSETHEV
jgi:hypothetical protein